MTAITMHTYADGFGIWHAVVRSKDDRYGAEEAFMHDVARAAIIRELKDRETIDDSVIAARIKETIKDGEDRVITYVEEIDRREEDPMGHLGY
jgi:hypothetical protein